ncbi:MAG: hypothetical protein MUD12_16505 [Spirochaetes bacterium]|nr:hypothetical protein [Spirochaetota bacterium]
MPDETGHRIYEHDHEKHSGELNLEQLTTLVPYLKKHNLDHIEDLKKWQLQTIEAGFDDIADELREIIELSKKIDYHFTTALDIIKRLG